MVCDALARRWPPGWSTRTHRVVAIYMPLNDRLLCAAGDTVGHRSPHGKTGTPRGTPTGRVILTPMGGRGAGASSRTLPISRGVAARAIGLRRSIGGTCPCIDVARRRAARGEHTEHHDDE
jgi:hypothetical protein